MKILILVNLFQIFAFADSSKSLIPPDLAFLKQDYGWADGEVKPLSQKETESVYQTIEFFVNEAIKGHAKNRLSWFDLQKFYSKIRTVSLYSNTTTQAIKGSGHRIGSIYLTEQRLIIFNIGLLYALTDRGGAYQFIAAGTETLFLHEFLGALGYPDEDYLLSSYIWMRTFPDDYGDPLFKKMENFLNQQIETKQLKIKNILFKLKDTELSPSVNDLQGGSSTGVGGGGDPASIAIKILTLARLGQQKEYLMEKYNLDENAYEHLIDKVLKLKIEPDPQIQEYLKNDSRKFLSSEVISFKSSADQSIAYLNVNILWKISKTKTISECATEIGEYLISLLVREQRAF